MMRIHFEHIWQKKLLLYEMYASDNFFACIQCCVHGSYKPAVYFVSELCKLGVFSPTIIEFST